MKIHLSVFSVRSVRQPLYMSEGPFTLCESGLIMLPSAHSTVTPSQSSYKMRCALNITFAYCYMGSRGDCVSYVLFVSCVFCVLCVFHESSAFLLPIGHRFANRAIN